LSKKLSKSEVSEIKEDSKNNTDKAKGADKNE